MKSLSGNATTAVGNALGEEPIIVLRIDWATGSLWYADRDYPLHAAQGRILNAGDLAAQIKLDSIGTVGAMSFVLDDSDGAMKALLDTNCAESTRAYIYQSFASAALDNDLILLLAGVLIAPVWNEGQRTFSFEVETRVQDVEVGYALEQEFYDNFVVNTPLLTDEAIGKAWPLCFGSNLHFPALKLIGVPETSLNQNFKKGDTSFLVEDASRFPDNTAIDVIIDGIVFQVTVDKANNRMNVGAANVPKYTSIPFAARDNSDPDAASPWVAWINQDAFIANTYIFFTSTNGNTVYHRVLRQEGRKIWLDNRSVQKKPSDTYFNTAFGVVPDFLGPPTIISQVAKFGRDGWGIEGSFVGGATTSNGYTQIKSYRDTLTVIDSITWKWGAGETVRMWADPTGSGQHSVVYVANLIPSTTVAAVYAWRTNPRTGQRLFSQIPTNYYSVNLADSNVQPLTSFNGSPSFAPTTITLKSSLKDLYAQGWEETIYVSLKSSVGPNAADIISWLITTYSNLAVDPVSFAAVKTALTNYPCAIVYQEKGNVLQMAEDIAWKSRCALLIEDGVAKLKYLSAEPSIDLNVTEDMIEHRSLSVATSRTEDIVTSFRATWRKDHSGRPGKEQTFVKLENVSRFGLRKREFDFNIYNIQSLVQKSATFWAHRMANSWVYAKMNVLKRTAIALEMCDCVNLTTDFTAATTKTIVETHTVDVTSQDQSTYGLSLWLPRVAGTIVQDPKAWLSDAGDTLPADPLNQLGQTSIGILWADDVSHSYVNHRIQTHPAKIVNDDADHLGFNVDVYDDGYEDTQGNDLPATNKDIYGNRIPIVAYPTDIAMSLDRQFPPQSPFGGLAQVRNVLAPGTRVQIFAVHGNRWMFNVPADNSHVLAKVNGPTPDALGRIGFTHYPNGFDAAPSLTELPAVYVGDVTRAAVGDKVHIIQRGDTQFAIPITAGGPTAAIYLITNNNGAGAYTGQLYDVPYGTPLGSPVNNLVELNVSANIFPGWWVLGFAFGDFVFFDRPLGSC